MLPIKFRICKESKLWIHVLFYLSITLQWWLKFVCDVLGLWDTDDET